MTEHNDRQTEQFLEQYLLFLRGRGPEPSVPEDDREAISGLFELIATLADRDPTLPEIEDDPVAIRLGLVDGPAPDDDDDTSGAVSAPSSDDPAAIERSLLELRHRFDGLIEVTLSPATSVIYPPALRYVGDCISLGEIVAVFVAPVDDWTSEPDVVAVLFRRRPELSAVALSSTTAERAVVLTAADSNRAIDPVLGWLAPGSPSLPEPLGIALGRHFARALPHWDRVAGLDDLLSPDDATDELSTIVGQATTDALAAKPRLEYKKTALRSLHALDPSAIVSIVNDVQMHHLAEQDLLDRLTAVAEMTSQ